MSGFVAHKLYGLHTIPRRYRDETGRMVKGDSEDEILRNVWRLAGRAFAARRSAARLAFQSPVLGAFCLRTINLRTICESSRFLRINLNHVMGYTSQLNVINV